MKKLLTEKDFPFVKVSDEGITINALKEKLFDHNLRIDMFNESMEVYKNLTKAIEKLASITKKQKGE